MVLYKTKFEWSLVLGFKVPHDRYKYTKIFQKFNPQTTAIGSFLQFVLKSS